MTNKWQNLSSNDVKPEAKKAKNHCQMHQCRALIKYKCAPPVEASPIFVCEFHMPMWRDKDYHISSATKVS